MLNDATIQAIRYYEGDVIGSDPFWGDSAAYVTLNALFFGGIQTEQARVAEGKRLNPALLGDEARLLALCRDLLAGFQPLDHPIETSRVERFSDYTVMRKFNATISFTSTSLDGYLDAYTDKRGLVLMRLTLPAGTPCIALRSALPSYLKADEAEVLLPPFLRLRLSERTGADSALRDRENNAPVLAIHASVSKRLAPMPPLLSPCPSDGPQAGQRVYEALNAGHEPADDDALRYLIWKTHFQSRVYKMARELFENRY